MELRELEDIERFFAGLGHKTPLAYYGLLEDAASEDIESAIKKRRAWAQGQQANPKFKTEALFLIKGNALLRRLLLDERDAYVEHFGEGNPKLTELNSFIRGLLSESGWNPVNEAAIRGVGRRLEFENDLVETRLQAIARELNVKREGDADLGDLGAIDAYELLAAPPTASSAELEAAYRARYRWARSLKDHQKSGQVLGALDAAWRILQEPERRRAYDLRRVDLGDATEEVERGSRELDALLEGGGVVERKRSSDALLEAVRLSQRAGVAAPEPPTFSMLFPGAGEALAGFAPPVVPEIQGRTIGLASGPQMVRERAPRLRVQAEQPIVLRLPRSGRLMWSLRVLNEGQGRMPGKVVSDVPWLVPARDWLDPLARQQDVDLEVLGSLMPSPAEMGTITVVTDHGQRAQLAIEVRRATLVGPLSAVLLLLTLGAGGWLAYDAWRASQASPPPLVLRLTIDPPADTVLVDGDRVGVGSSLEIAPPALGQPFRIRIERAGFRAHEELVTLGEQSLTRSVRLELTDKLDWQGGEGDPGELPPERLKPLTDATAAVRGCLGRQEGALLVRVRADAEGVVRGMDLEGEGFDSESARPCVGRVARTIAVGAPVSGAWSQGGVTLNLGLAP